MPRDEMYGSGDGRKRMTTWEWMKKEPAIPIGVTGCLLLIGRAAYMYPKRDRVIFSTGTYLMHLRVRAQGFIVATITLGMAYKIYKSTMAKRLEESSLDNSQDT